MKERHCSQEDSAQKNRLNQSNDQLALRGLAAFIFESNINSIDLESLAETFHFHPVALAFALATLETDGIIQIIDNRIIKLKHAERRILALRTKLLRTKSKPYWKTVDLRHIEETRFKVMTRN
jgi:hypothetical protein